MARARLQPQAHHSLSHFIVHLLFIFILLVSNIFVSYMVWKSTGLEGTNKAKKN